MRVETKRLLDRLGQSDFKYREYHEVDAQSSTARWPLFELIDRQMNDLRSVPSNELATPTQPVQTNDIKSLINRISAERQS